MRGRLVTMRSSGATTFALSIAMALVASSSMAHAEDEPRPTPAPPPLVAPQPAPADERNLAPAYASFGVAAAGIVVGSIYGLSALSKKSDLTDACPKNQCAESERDTLDAGKAFGVVSTIGFVVGAVGIAAGTFFYLDSATTKKTARPSTTPAVILGLGRVGLSGAF